MTRVLVTGGGKGVGVVVAQMGTFMGDHGTQLVIVEAVDQPAGDDDQRTLARRAAGKGIGYVGF